jgi:hypothetical protein
MHNIFSYRNLQFYFVLWVLIFPLKPVYGQNIHLNSLQIDNKFSEVWKTSEILRKNYSWYAKREFKKNDKVLDVLVEKYAFGSDGKLNVSEISHQQTELPSTIIIHQFAEASKQNLINFLTRLEVFLKKYSLTDNNIRNSYFSKASIGKPDANGKLIISGNNVITKGDQLIWWIDTKSYSTTKAYINTAFEGQVVKFTAYYNNLPPGINYMTLAEIVVPGKNIVVRLEFYNFIKIK